MNNIRKFFAWLCFAAVGAGVIGCSGNTEDPEPVDTSKPILTADKSDILADGIDYVTFTVILDGEDITSSAAIRCTSHTGIVVSEAVFSTTTAGNYVFEAVYGDKTSAAYTVSAIQSDVPIVSSQFVRQVCVMEFTGQWCAQCPDGYNYLWYVISWNYADKAHIIALHDNSSGEDEMAIPVQKELFSTFKLTGYPAAVIDLRDASPLTNDTNGLLKKAIKASLNDYPAHCGVAVKSDYSEASGKASVTVRLFPETSGEYRLALWIVEDAIVAKQNNGGKYTDDYTHNHVARRLASTSWQGDNLGNIQADQEISKTYEITVDELWNLDNTSVFALAVDASGHVNNMAICTLRNGNTDYAYIPE